MECRTIFLVEDDAAVREMIREIFRKEYEILEAATYSSALEHIHGRMDLALIDYVLPDGDGLDLVGDILREKQSLPIILMTAYNHEAVILRALRAGVRDYIKKPLSISDLRSRISDLLGETVSDECGKSEEAEQRREFIIDSIRQYIDEHYMKDLTLDEISSMAGMNKFSFCKAFKERTGKNFIAFLNHVRISRAAELLKNRDLNITDIALFVGYCSIEHFNRMFRSAFGVSPTEYRKRIIDVLPPE